MIASLGGAGAPAGGSDEVAAEVQGYRDARVP